MNRLQGIWYINTNRHEISARTDSAFLKISGWQLMAVVIFSLKKLILFLSYFTFRFFKALFIDGFVIHAKHRLFRAKGTKNYLCTGLIFVNSLLISLSFKKSQYRFFNANICKNMKHWYPEIQYICNFTPKVTQMNYCNGSSSILKKHL